jgi:hypothetical protein
VTAGEISDRLDADAGVQGGKGRIRLKIGLFYVLAVLLILPDYAAVEAGDGPQARMNAFALSVSSQSRVAARLEKPQGPICLPTWATMCPMPSACSCCGNGPC